MIVLEIKPSRLQFAFMAILHLAAAFSFTFGLELGPAGFIVAAVLASSLVRSIVASRRGLPMALGLKEDGGMCLRPHGMAEVDAVADGASVVSAPVLWVAWREQQAGRRRGVLLLVRDQLAPEDWRRLQVWARLRARPAVAGAGSESRP